MSNGLLHVSCSVCGSELPVPPEHDFKGKAATVVECDTCHIRHELRLSRLDRPEKWSTLCTECGETRDIPWEEMMTTETNGDPYCHDCGASVSLIIHYN